MQQQGAVCVLKHELRLLSNHVISGLHNVNKQVRVRPPGAFAVAEYVARDRRRIYDN